MSPERTQQIKAEAKEFCQILHEVPVGHSLALHAIQGAMRGIVPGRPDQKTYEAHLRLACEDFWLKSVSGKTDEYERLGFWKSDFACHKLRILKDKIVALVGQTEMVDGG
jgi:hypothetical protein